MDGRLTGNLVIDGGAMGLTVPELQRWFTQMRAEGLVEVAGDIVLRDVALLDDVMTTGATLDALVRLALKKAAR